MPHCKQVSNHSRDDHTSGVTQLNTFNVGVSTPGGLTFGFWVVVVQPPSPAPDPLRLWLGMWGCQTSIAPQQPVSMDYRMVKSASALRQCRVMLRWM